MTYYDRYKRGAVEGAPAQLPLSRGQLTQETALEPLAAAMGEVARDLYQKEDTIRRNQQVATATQLQLESDKYLQELKTADLAEGAVDEKYSQWFGERSQAILASQPDPNARREMSGALRQVYLRDQINAQSLQESRVREASVQQFEQITSTAMNIVRSHPTRQTEAEQTITQALANMQGVYSPEELQKLQRESFAKLTYMGASAIIEKDPQRGIAALEAGQYDERITPELKDRLLSQGKVELRRRESEANIERRLTAQSATELYRLAQADLEAGYVPNYAPVRAQAEAAGKYGAAILQRLDQLEGRTPLLTSFNRMDITGKTKTLQDYENRLAQGTLTGTERQDFELLKDSFRNTTKQAKENGYALAVRSKLFEPVALDGTLDPRALQLREQQAASVRQTFGTAAAVTSKPERDALVAQIRAAKPEDASAIMGRLQENSPSIAADVAGALAKDVTEANLALAVAFTADPDARTKILRGDRLARDSKLNLGEVIPPGFEVDAARRIRSVLPGLREESVGGLVEAAKRVHLANMTDPSTGKASILAKGASADKLIDQILPGNPVDQALTTSRDETPRQFRTRVRDLAASNDWWQSLRKVDPSTSATIPFEAAPTDVPKEALRPENLRFVAPGEYRVVYRGRDLRTGYKPDGTGGELVILNLNPVQVP